MIGFLRASVFCLSILLLSMPAAAQYQGNIPAGTVLGNPQTTAKPAAPSTFAQMGLTPNVVNNTALRAKSTASVPAGGYVTRLAFATSGDAPPLPYYASPSACSLNSGGGENGSQVQSADGKCWLAMFPAEGADVRQFGAKCDGHLVSGSWVGTNNAPIINAALAVNPVVVIPASTTPCLVGAPLNITLDNSVLAGAGIGATTIISTTAATSAISIGAGLTQVTLKGFTVDRGVTATLGANGVDFSSGITNATIDEVRSQNHWWGFALGGAAFGTVSRSVAQNNYSDGFHLFNSAGHSAAQWVMNHTLSQANNGWGYNVVSALAGGALVVLPWVGAETFANTLGGAGFHGQAGAAIYDITLESCVFSTDGANELEFDTYGGQIKVGAGTFIELAGTGNTGRNLATAPSHVGYGILASGAVGDIKIDDTFVSANSQHGGVLGSFRTMVTNSVFVQNGQAAANTYYGLDILNTISGSTALVSNNRIGNQNNTTPQGPGLGFSNGVGAVAIGNDLSFSGPGSGGLNVASNATSLIAHGNLGFQTEATGVSNIPAGQTSVVVTHGLAFTPTQVLLTPNTDPGAGRIWVDTLTSTTFTVHISAAPGPLVGFSWAVKVFNT